MAKNETNINRQLAIFKTKSKFGIPNKPKNKSMDNNNPITRNEKDLNDFRNFSLTALSIRVITNNIINEAKNIVCNNSY